MPSIRCLQMWAEKLLIRFGFLHNVLEIMKLANETLPNLHKYCTLMFDEMKVKSFYEYDTTQDKIVARYSQLQVLMVSSLFSKWKQPIYIDLDQKITKDTILKAIEILEGIGYHVYGFVSDCGGENFNLMKQFEITPENYLFLNPKTNKPVYFLPDVHNLIKLLRNRFLNHGFVLHDGTCINKQSIEALLRTKTSFMLQEKHLIVSAIKRENVELAVQLFSRQTSDELREYSSSAKEGMENAKNLADFIDIVNDWFAIMNSKSNAELVIETSYGLNLEIQEKALNNMYKTVNSMCCGSKQGLQTFQKAILISINSIKGLHYYLTQKDANITYILTKNISRIALQSFFREIKRCSGKNSLPTVNQAMAQIKVILLSKNPGLVQTDVYYSGTEEYLTSGYFANVGVELNVSNFIDASISAKNASELTDDAIECIAGLIAKQYQFHDLTETNLDINMCNLPCWVQEFLEDDLPKPTKELKEQCLLMNKCFKQAIPLDDDVVKYNNILFTLCEKMKNIRKLKHIDCDVRKRFFELRINIRVKYLNQKENLQKLKRKSFNSNNNWNDDGICKRLRIETI